jgi:hypothetical protein
MYAYNNHEIEPHVVPTNDGHGFITTVIHIRRGYKVTEFFPSPAIVFPTEKEAVAAAIAVSRKVVDRGYDSDYNPYVQ